MKLKLKNFAYTPSEHGGRDFHTKFNCPTDFSPPNYFKTVFSSGADDLLNEIN